MNAYNAQSPSALHVDSGYIFAVDSTPILYLPQGTPEPKEITVSFNKALQIEVRMAGVQ